ncbi:MAG: hypothetical protein HZC14_00840 [Candidatus Niyogibacteria bacterium]|nr:hypothetical protein [Candidatus Niyogibacteria bacterium]
MDIKNVLSVISGILFAAAYIPYIRTILNGKTKPAKASWIIWASLDAIIIAGMMAENSVNYQIICAFLGSSAVATLSLKYGIPGWSVLDKACFIGAILGIILWGTFNNPLFGIIISLGVMFVGSVPTFVSVWKDPSHEDRFAWTLFWLSCVVAIPAIPHWTVANAAQPLTFFAIETVMMYILFIKSPVR